MLLENEGRGNPFYGFLIYWENLEKYSGYNSLFLRDGDFIYRQKKETVQEQVLLFPS